MSNTILWLIPLFELMISIIDLVDDEEKNDENAMLLLQNNVLTTITLVNLLNMICELTIHILEDETDDKLHQLIRCILGYQWVQLKYDQINSANYQQLSIMLLMGI